MGRQRRFKKQDILDALKDSYGVVSEVADRLGVDWHTADTYIKSWPETMQAKQDEDERYLDLAELKCIERVKAADGSMIRFVLATKGKTRGYNTEDSAARDDATADTEVNINLEGGEPAPVEADE